MRMFNNEIKKKKKEVIKKTPAFFTLTTEE